MPEGVEHLRNPTLRTARRRVIDSVMPEGVEHRFARSTEKDGMPSVIDSVMPEGVEHWCTALLRGSKTDPQRPLPTDPLTTDSVRRRPTKLSHLIEDVTCEDGLRLLPRPTARSKALPDDQLVPEEGVLHTGLLMVARVLLPLSPSSGVGAQIKCEVERDPDETGGMKSRVHPKYKTKYRVRNWASYERALIGRGNITIWLSRAAIAAWKPERTRTRGAPPKYSDLAIETALTLRLLFHLPLRQAEGFLTSLFI